jgi:ketosteroid isomerase-like protein
MERHVIEAALRSAYERRGANDADGATRIFAPDATYRIAGHKDFCSAVTTYRGAELKPALAKLCENFRATKFDMTAIVIDGDRASVMVQATFLAPAGQSVTTELAHFWTFDKAGKAVELVEFFDTAHVAHLQGARA